MDTTNLNLKALRSKAKENGFCCYWKTNKTTLVDALGTFNKTSKIPSQFIPKQKIGAACVKSDDCRSKKCIENKCIGSKIVRKRKVKNDDDLFYGVLTVPSEKSSEKKASKSVKKPSDKKVSSKVSKSIKKPSEKKVSSTVSKSIKKSTKKSTKKSSDKKPSDPKIRESIVNNKNVTKTSTTFTKDGKKCISKCTTRCKI